MSESRSVREDVAEQSTNHSPSLQGNTDILPKGAAPLAGTFPPLQDGDLRGEDSSFLLCKRASGTRRALSPQKVYFSASQVRLRESYTFLEIASRFKGMSYNTLLRWRDDPVHPLIVHGKKRTRVYGEDLVRFELDRRNPQ